MFRSRLSLVTLCAYCPSATSDPDERALPATSTNQRQFGEIGVPVDASQLQQAQTFNATLYELLIVMCRDTCVLENLSVSENCRPTSTLLNWNAGRWRSGNVVGRINEVTERRTLVSYYWNGSPVFGRANHLSHATHVNHVLHCIPIETRP